MPSAYISMFRGENEGSEALWDLLDRATGVSGLPSCSEFWISVVGRFQLEFEPGKDESVKIYVPLGAALLLSSLQLETYITYNCIFAQKMKVASADLPLEESLFLADKLACQSIEPEVLMGSLARADLIEFLWDHEFKDSAGVVHIHPSAQETILRFKENNLSDLEPDYLFILRIGGETILNGQTHMHFRARIAKLNCVTGKVVDAARSESPHALFDLTFQGLHDLVTELMEVHKRLLLEVGAA